VLLAGGIAEQADVRVALAGGAVAAVAGTRFLASDESRAHPGYKQRLVAGSQTLLTELFGMAWPRAPHRVLPNAATRRWLGDHPTGQPTPGGPLTDTRGPAALRAAHLLLAPLARRTPMSVPLRLARRPRSGLLDLSPAPVTDDLPEPTLETHPLYAGETVARIADIRPAADLVRELTP
jgi:nitronate monooxygenase